MTPADDRSPGLPADRPPASHATDTADPVRRPARPERPGGARRSGVLRELRSLPTLLLVVLSVFGGIPLVIALTPSQEVEVAGQHLAVGARTPTASLSGPAQLVQIGNTELDIARLDVWGPLRPQLTLGPVQRDAAAATLLDPERRSRAGSDAVGAMTSGFVRWYAWATAGVVVFALAASAAVGLVRLLVTIRRQTRDEHRHVTAADVWQRSAGQIRGMTVVAVSVTVLAWLGAGALAYSGAVNGLRDVRSLSDLVGTYYLSPSPVGPAVDGYSGAVIGDSRASRVGGPVVPEPTDDDRACVRSTDSLADQLGFLLDRDVLNLACPGASIPLGLRGPQEQGGRVLPSQVGRLKQVDGLDFVVVVIGPNDLYWGDFLAYCYVVDDCSDNLTQGEFGYRLAAFDRDYGNLLQDLNDLPGEPQVVIMTSYDVFDAGAADDAERAEDTGGAEQPECPDLRGPDGSAGLGPDNVDLLAERNADLNEVLRTGAEKYGFAVATPRLTPLCATSPDELGPDLQGLDDPHPFHPTGLGMVRLASAVAQQVDPSR